MENGNNSAREVLDPLVVCGERELCGKTALCWQCCGGTGLTADPTGGGFSSQGTSEASRISGFLLGQQVHPTFPAPCQQIKRYDALGQFFELCPAKVFLCHLFRQTY